MRSLASLLTLALVAPAAASAQLPPEAAGASGPSGTAGGGRSGGAYDTVLYADVEPLPGAPSIAAPLAVGSYAEVTALDSGRTVLVLVASTAERLRLSRAAAEALGLASRGAVRVRAVTPPAADVAALRRGEPASPRLDTPEMVLRPLRRQLPVKTATTPPRIPLAPGARARPGARTVADFAPPPPTALKVGAATVPATEVPPVELVGPPLAAGRLMVGVETGGDERRARDIAGALGGTAERRESGWRVRVGPYTDLAKAQAARDGAVARGYADAFIFIVD